MRTLNLFTEVLPSYTIKDKLYFEKYFKLNTFESPFNDSEVILILRDRDTDEIFKAVLKSSDLEKIKMRHGSLFINGSNSNTPRTLIMDNYLNEKFDVNKLSTVSRESLRNFITTKIDYDMISINNESVESLIINEIFNDGNPVYEKEFADFVYDLYQKSNAYEVLDKSYYGIKIRFILLCHDYFSGKFKVYTDRYDDNVKENTFDSINIEIRMNSDYNKNLQYIYHNRNYVNKLIRYILEHDETSKDYANYLKMYNLVLSRDNTLIARFCFKDGLESKCNI